MECRRAELYGWRGVGLTRRAGSKRGGVMNRFQKSCTLVLLLFASTARAAKITLAPGVPGLEDASLNINLQIQTWVQAVENQAPNGTSFNTQIFLRRIRS